MKQKGMLGGIVNHTEGFIPPRPGEGLYICRKCGKHFTNMRSHILSEIIGGLFVMCPECGSFYTERNQMVAY